MKLEPCSVQTAFTFCSVSVYFRFSTCLMLCFSMCVYASLILIKYNEDCSITGESERPGQACKSSKLTCLIEVVVKKKQKPTHFFVL